MLGFLMILRVKFGLIGKHQDEDILRGSEIEDMRGPDSTVNKVILGWCCLYLKLLLLYL